MRSIPRRRSRSSRRGVCARVRRGRAAGAALRRVAVGARGAQRGGCDQRRRTRCAGLAGAAADSPLPWPTRSPRRGRCAGFGLVDVEQEALRIEARVWLREPVLDRFCGALAHEPEVQARIAPVAINPALADDSLSRQVKTSLIDRAWIGSPIVFAGNVEPAIVAASVAALSLRPCTMTTAAIPDDPEARDRSAGRLWSRDAALDGAALIVIADERSGGVLADSWIAWPVTWWSSASGRRPAPQRAHPDSERAGMGDGDRRGSLAPRAGRGACAETGRRSRAGCVQLQAAASRDRRGLRASRERDRRCCGSARGGAAPVACRGPSGAAGPRARRVDGRTQYRWQDIVLASPIEAALRRVEMRVRHATTVMDEWGFGERMGGRGRGVAALFAGPSGTGKNDGRRSARLVARPPDDGHRPQSDHQQHVGETSKNIAAAFDQAECCGAVMVWNEGDAPSGAHAAPSATPRIGHVNAEIGDLLQRIEAFRGFTIVTTNMRHAIDPAFLRRFRFAIDFPMPSQSERLRLWQQAFRAARRWPRSTGRRWPSSRSGGGSIRNVALGSARSSRRKTAAGSMHADRRGARRGAAQARSADAVDQLGGPLVNGTGPTVRPVRIVIRRIGITRAASSLEARRPADALPPRARRRPGPDR